MLLLTRLSVRLRRRRAEIDQVWREATRADAAQHGAAVGRILSGAAGIPDPCRKRPDGA